MPVLETKAEATTGQRGRFSLGEYERMIDSGAFAPSTASPQRRRLELLRGDIVETSPIGTYHASTVSKLLRWSFRVGPVEKIDVRVQSPLRIPALVSMPEPDIAWVALKDYAPRHPSQDDVLLLIEVADSSLTYDLNEKALVYAQAGIADYWVVNIPEELVEVFRDPTPSGYHDRSAFKAGQSVATLAYPEAVLSLDELFARGA